MEFRQLKYFVQVCNDHSFTKAANSLFISQQGLSISIKRLEEELNAKLLIKSSAGYEPTAEGKFLLDRANQIVTLFDECEHFFLAGGVSTSALTIACVVGLMGYYQDFFSLFLNDFNEMERFKFVELSTQKCEEMLLNNTADLAFIPGPMDEKRFIWHTLYQVPNYVIMNRSHPLAQEKSIDFSQLRDQRLVTFNEEFKVYHQLVDRCQAFGFRPNIVLKLDQTPAIFHMVQSNPSLLGIHHARGVQHWLLPGLCAVPISDASFQWEVNLVLKKESPLTADKKRFIRQSLNYFRTHPNGQHNCNLGTV